LNFTPISRHFPSIAFIISLVSGTIYLVIVGSFVAPDAAMFCDIARYISNNGKIGSFVINDGYQNPYRAPFGLIPHMGTALLFSFSFMLGTVDALFAQLTIMLIAPTIIGLVLGILDDGTLIYRAVAIPPLALMPAFFHYSTSIYGPELYSLFLTIMTLVTFWKGLSSRNRNYLFFILAGIFTFLEAFTWSGNQLPLLIAAGLMTILQKPLRTKIKLWIFPAITFLVVAYIPRVSSNIMLWILLLLLFSIFLLVCLVGEIPLSKHLGVFSVTYFFFWQVSLLRSYLNPGILIDVASQAADQTGGVSLLIPTVDQLILSVYYLVRYIGPILLVMAIGSIFYFREEKLPIYCLFGGYLVFQFIGRYSYIMYEERFYIGFSLCVMGLAIVFIVKALKGWAPTRNRISELFSPSSSRNIKPLVATFTVVVLISFSVYTPAYISNAVSVDSYSHTANGWDEIRDWGDDNFLDEDNILVLGSPRDWTWFLNRSAIGFYRFEGVMPIDISEVNVSHLIDQIEEFSIDWIIVDTSATWWRRWINLDFLYANLEVDTPLVIQSKNRSYLLICKLISISSVTDTPVTVYSVISYNETTPTFIENFEDMGLWENDTQIYPLEDPDSFSIKNGMMMLNLSINDDSDFDRVYSNTPSLNTVNCTLETRIRVKSEVLRALYFTVTQNDNATGNWIQWFYIDPPIGEWITVSVFLPKLIGLSGRSSEALPSRIECVAITALTSNQSDANIEIDYIHIGAAQTIDHVDGGSLQGKGQSNNNHQFNTAAHPFSTLYYFTIKLKPNEHKTTRGSLVTIDREYVFHTNTNLYFERNGVCASY
jgi:hypothetical protein